MAHQLTMLDGYADMAYVGETPWHGLGNAMPSDADINKWQIASGTNFEVCRTPVKFQNGTLHTWKENEVLYRSDNNLPLGLVSSRYKIVQPPKLLEFFRNLVEQDGFTIETAGSLNGGKRIWALARTGFDAEVVDGDMVKSYILIETSYDRKSATTARKTSIRVVCQNTLHLAFSSDNCDTVVTIPHSTDFDAASVQISLGLNHGAVFEAFMLKMRGFANTSLSGQHANEIIEALFARQNAKGDIREKSAFKNIMAMFNGDGKGANMDGVAGTGWGLVNAVTEFVDFKKRARSNENRLNSAWFGSGNKMKQDIVELLDSF